MEPSSVTLEPYRRVLGAMVFTFLNLLAIGEPSMAGTGARIETDFEVPLHYTTDQAGDFLFLHPPSTEKRMTCMYGISPSRASTGSLETDADKALAVAAPPGYTVVTSSAPASMRGRSASGWPFFWRRAEYTGQFKGGPVSVRAMAMVFPAGSGRVNVVFGVGPVETCSLDDASFAQLFHSLHPHGWQADGANSLGREIAGVWSFDSAVAAAAFVFTPTGRYTFSARFKLETGKDGKNEGRYEIQGDELLLISDDSDQGTQRSRISLYEEWRQGHWTRGMSLLQEVRSPDKPLIYYLQRYQGFLQR